MIESLASIASASASVISRRKFVASGVELLWGLCARRMPEVYVPTQEIIDTSCLPPNSWLGNNGVWKLFGIDTVIDQLIARKLPLGKVTIMCGDTGTGPSPHVGIDLRCEEPINGFDDYIDGIGHGTLGAGLCLDFNPAPKYGQTRRAALTLIDVQNNLMHPDRKELSDATDNNPHAALLYIALSRLGALADERIKAFLDAGGTVVCAAGNGGHVVPGESETALSDSDDSVITLPYVSSSVQEEPTYALWHPATLDGVIAAVSVDGLDLEGYLGTPDPTSSPGGAKPETCLAAPGRHLSSTAKGGDKNKAGYYANIAEGIRGTSFAAPNLAAFFALLASIHLGDNPDITPRQAVQNVVNIALQAKNCRHPGKFDTRYDDDVAFCALGVPQADRILNDLGIKLYKIYAPLMLTPKDRRDRSQSQAITRALNTKISRRNRRA